jgi:hypothetical protein
MGGIARFARDPSEEGFKRKTSHSLALIPIFISIHFSLRRAWLKCLKTKIPAFAD